MSARLLQKDCIVENLSAELDISSAASDDSMESQINNFLFNNTFSAAGTYNSIVTAGD